MFSFGEILFLLVLALVVVGPQQVPVLARQIGRFLNEMRRASESLTKQFREPPDIHPLQPPAASPPAAAESPRAEAPPTVKPTGPHDV